MDDGGARQMACMEVWGGNHAVDRAVVLSGLDVWVYAKPFGQAVAGGDVHYLSSCATGRISRVLLADVSGHGVGAAETARTLHDLMRRYINCIDQSAFVKKLNRQFAAVAHAGSFATAVAVTFFSPTGQLWLCNAGHPTPLLYRAKEKQWTFLRMQADDDGHANIPLGILDATNYAQFNFTMGEDDIVLCYADSLTEARDARGRALGEAGLLAMVRETPIGEAETFVHTLLERITAFDAGGLSDDDVTVLMVRANDVRKPLGERMLAPARLLRGGLTALSPAGGPVPWPEISVRNLGGALFEPLSRVGGQATGGGHLARRNAADGSRAPQKP